MNSHSSPHPDRHPCRVRKLTPDWTIRDHLGAWRVRWGIRRDRYRVQPGLYGVGQPGPEDPVLVTANYKLTVDVLRRELAGRNVWLLVLNTHGVNVWCAAGKRTFSTQELVKRVTKHRLAEVVSHRKLVLPQLGAPGVAAHDVHRMTGFKVVYGPVRAVDVPAFLDRGMQADETMRTVTFRFRERLAVVPVELVQALRYAVPAALMLVLAGLFGGVPGLLRTSRWAAMGLGAVFTGTVAFPLLLPAMPFRSFAASGGMLGALYAGGVAVWTGVSPWVGTAMVLMLAPLVSFLAVNFTGATPFTSMSGVELELKRGVPVMVASVLIGLGAAVAGWWLGG